MSHNIEEVEIIPGMHETHVIFRDTDDVDWGLRGRTVYRITLSSWGRLLRAINKLCSVRIEPDCYSFITIARRNHCPTCGDGDYISKEEIYSQCEAIEE
jgi:hypothetical protein